MYAIVDIAGKQFKVTKDQFVYAPSVAGEEGASVEFDRVLLFGGDNGVEVGTPLVSGVTIAGKILEHGRGDKVIIFKKKRRKGYKKTQGHRQDYTKILIEDILKDGKKTAASKKADAAPKKKEEKPESISTAATPVQEQDDLKQINGVGPAFEKALHEQGVYTFKQIAEMSSEEMDRIDEAIDGVTRQMIEEEWIPQAKELIK